MFLKLGNVKITSKFKRMRSFFIHSLFLLTLQILNLSCKDVSDTKMGNGERGTSTGNGKMQNGKKQRIGNEVTDRARVQELGFVPIFHFLVPHSLFPVLVKSILLLL